ncbi:Spy/CpxP family protein refolding chaperone [Lichenicoccus sp.]|uniref:Spy/CpxP family protein refolding chaperone n=1 Tax=Lichenicoccus sp. TaxID=2781899 RepID=UPI003D0DE92A
MSRSEASATARHIATLHAKLHITPAQEALWRPLAAAMWNSVAALDHVYAERGRHYDQMSAVDDLRSYGLVQQTNADNVKSLIAPFERLYASFSPAQKRRADMAVRQFTDSAVKASR